MDHIIINVGNKTTKLPTYLGFGKLDINSIQSSTDYFTADYLMDGHLVNRIKFQNIRFIHSSFFDEERLSVTPHFSFTDAFIRNYETINSATDPRFGYLNKKLNNQGDVFFQTPQIPPPKGVPIKNSFPAGQIFYLRYIYYRESKNLERLLSDIERNKYEHLMIKNRSMGILYYYYKTNVIPGNPIKVLDFVCPLAYILDYVQIIRDYNILLSGNEHRLVIQDYARVLSFDLEFFLGGNNADYYSYGILYKKPEDNNSLDYHTTFINGSRNLINNYHNL